MTPSPEENISQVKDIAAVNALMSYRLVGCRHFLSDVVDDGTYRSGHESVSYFDLMSPSSQ